ncbi:hypothetical protein PR202_ga18763 [Eleusine coracana subsp. coracana]|uniref:Uncharacterized protein n=1 Tax=Eleusine coracana subsp. coracana TaxID=191504 RepID=A0AAV5CU71_ELECO|nr:hypothetical protein PR202_ga18763 [Eleusine coracana subsp. coracana]
MASLFVSRRRRSPEEDEDDDRSGNGRSQRRRISPEEDAASPADAGATAESSPGWLTSFVSGAKSSYADENEDVHDTYGAIVPYSDSKLAIEQMVMKEKFSRDEFDKMVELLKTRVTDSNLPDAFEYGTPKDIPSRNMGSGYDFTGAWRSLNRDRNFPGSVPFSGMRSGSFSPGSPLQTSPELCTAAVKEAKKWLEEKRKGTCLKPEDNGPCTLNTDMFSSGLDSDMGSPVDLAKSYMRSLPPWQSPFLGGERVNTFSGGVHINDDEGPSSKVMMKEDYLSNFWTNLEESRRTRMGSFGGSADATKSRHYGSTTRLFENDTSIFSSDAGRTPAPETLKGPKDPCTADAVQDHRFKKTVLAAACSIVSVNPISDGKPGPQFTGFILGRYEHSGVVFSVIVTSSAAVCDEDTKLEPLPKGGTGGPVIDHDGLFRGMAFNLSPEPAVLSISTIMTCFVMFRHSG